MKRESFLVVLGVVIAISPFVGLPLSWLMYILPILGLLIVVIGISLRHDLQMRGTSDGSHDLAQNQQILPQ
jgi:TRAP-type C4-dicarboxylate transport system permease small subunit